MYPAVVWIDPQDDEQPTWWTAMFVPKDQVDSSMPVTKKKQYVVTFWDETPR
jgi:hypothetical protein